MVKHQNTHISWEVDQHILKRNVSMDMRHIMAVIIVWNGQMPALVPCVKG